MRIIIEGPLVKNEKNEIRDLIAVMEEYKADCGLSDEDCPLMNQLIEKLKKVSE